MLNTINNFVKEVYKLFILLFKSKFLYKFNQRRALIDWFYSFEHYIMFELDATVKLSKIGLTLSPSDFCNVLFFYFY
jgi:hypothetical protein